MIVFKILRNFWKIVSTLVLILGGIAITFWLIDDWSIEQLYDYTVTVLTYGIPTVLILWILYKLFFEKLYLWYMRKQSAKVIIDELSQVNQVSGAVRSGKDSSTVAAAMITKEEILRREKKELKELQYKLYIYDFEKLDTFLDEHGKRFFKASDKAIKYEFKKVMKHYDCFLTEYHKKKIDPQKHYNNYFYRSKSYIPDVAYHDGITKGGTHFLKMLQRYILLYMYHHYIPQFIMSNQPILEDVKIDKKTGRKQMIYSKMFSQDFIKLKEPGTPMPFPMRGFIIQTETSITNPNTDKEEAEYFKDKSGMREAYTTIGHLLRENVFYYDITQSPVRTMLALRELYPGYQHIFKRKFRSTSDFSRLIIKIRIVFKKLKVFRTRFKRFLVFHLYRSKKHENLRRLSIKIYKLKRKISKMYQKEAIKFSKGYIVFYKGVYENINDVGKRVSFPRFGLLQDNRKNTTTYQTKGFKQTVKITDCFGLYDTHFFYSVREIKNQINDMDFTQVRSWTKFEVEEADYNYMNYNTLNSLMQPIKHFKEQRQIQREILLNEIKQKPPTIPELEKLDNKELLHLIDDVNHLKYQELIRTLRVDLITVLSKVHDKDVLRESKTKELKELAEKEIDKKQLDYILESFRNNLILSLNDEYRTMKEGI